MEEETNCCREQHVSPPWTKGKPLDPELFGDLEVPMFEACDNEGKFFAVKEVLIVTHQSKKGLEDPELPKLVQEIKILSSLAHENIVQYMGCEIATVWFKTAEKRTLSVFLKLVSQKSLSSVYRDFKKLSERQVSGYTRHILKGIEYLHDKQIVHGDIRCATIWVDGDGTCRLADFGLAEQLISNLDGRHAKVGTLAWMAPEVFDQKQRNLRADIWSLGCTVIEMFSASPPYGELEESIILRNLVKSKTAPKIPDTLSENAKDFIKQCLQIDPLERPTATELLRHPFVASLQKSRKPSEIQHVGFDYTSHNWDKYSKLSRLVMADGAAGGTLLKQEQNPTKKNKEPKMEERASTQQEKQQNLLADIWTFTCTVIDGELEKPQKEIILTLNNMRIIKGELQAPQMPDALSETAKDIIRQCLQVDPYMGSQPSGMSKIAQSPVEETSDIQKVLEQLLYEISQELEDGGGEIYLFDGESWMGKLNEEDREKIAVKFEDGGYIETANTDTHICYEKIPCEMPIQLLANMPSNQLADTQDAGEKSLVPQASEASGSNQQDSKDESIRVPGTNDSNAQLLKFDIGGEMEVSEAITKHSEESKVNWCAHDCESLPLKVTYMGIREKLEGLNIGSSSRSQESKPKAKLGYFAEFNETLAKKLFNNNVEEEFHAEIMLSCCVESEAKQLCIKLSHMAGQINKAAPGSVMKEMRVSLAATIDNDPISLVVNDMNRVIRKAKASQTYEYVKRGHDKSFQVAPTASLCVATLTPSVGVGGMNWTPREEGRHFFCHKGEELDLVVLREGDGACSGIQLGTVLVLQRNVQHTWLTGNESEQTAVSIRGCPNPVTLTGEFNTSSAGEPHSKLSITCCVELEVNVIDDLAQSHGKSKIMDPIVMTGKKKDRRIKFSKSGHALFEGAIPLP